MREFDPQELIVHNQAELEDLSWEIEAAAGQFALLVARCNYAGLRDVLIERLQQICPVVLRVVTVTAAETALYTRILAAVQDGGPEGMPGAVMVVGLETIANLERSLTLANQVREEFRQNCPVPIVFWVTDAVMQGWVQAAPDLESWATKTRFTLPPSALAQVLAAADRWFERLLDPAGLEAERSGELLGGLQASEVEAALQELRQQGRELDPALRADLAWAEGLNALNATDPGVALGLFERSLAFWVGEAGGGSDRASLKVALLWVYSARSRFALSESEDQAPDWEGIRELLERAIARFEGLQRLELVGSCIPLLERVLQKLQVWAPLEAIARRGLELHQGAGNRTRLSQDYGFLARALVEQGRWEPARAAAQRALTELDGEPADLDWLRGMYRCFAAEAERGLGNLPGAIALLTAANAQVVSDLGYPKPAIRILAVLREVHLALGQYWEAFEAKQARLSVEQQYGLRAFVGAGRLQAQRQAVVREFAMPTGGQVAPEIAAAGRQQDLARLVERVELNDYKLTVIHGGSGVGKSSLVNAGLVPMLRQGPISARDNLPVVVRTYTQWVDELSQQLQRGLVAIGRRSAEPGLTGDPAGSAAAVASASLVSGPAERAISTADPHVSSSDPHVSSSEPHPSHSEQHPSRSEQQRSHFEPHPSHAEQHPSHSEPHPSHAEQQRSPSEPHPSRSEPQQPSSEPEVSNTEPQLPTPDSRLPTLKRARCWRNCGNWISKACDRC
jgi:tetratricopeptide (TPR) repeat protein